MLPVSFARLTNLKWLDLKENPLEPYLKKVVGDCLDDKQCKTCAKRVCVVLYQVLATIPSNVMYWHGVFRCSSCQPHPIIAAFELEVT